MYTKIRWIWCLSHLLFNKIIPRIIFLVTPCFITETVTRMNTRLKCTDPVTSSLSINVWCLSQGKWLVGFQVKVLIKQNTDPLKFQIKGIKYIFFDVMDLLLIERLPLYFLSGMKICVPYHWFWPWCKTCGYRGLTVDMAIR